MSHVLVDSNVKLDIFQDDPDWAPWSEDTLHRYSSTHVLSINPVIYSEISMGFECIEPLESVVEKGVASN